MKASLTISIIISLAFLAGSCSELLLEPYGPEEISQETVGLPMTRAQGTQSQTYDEATIRHYFQTNSRALVIHHVELSDSGYVQTLTKEDMASLNIPESEQGFGEAYVEKLNEMLKSQ